MDIISKFLENLLEFLPIVLVAGFISFLFIRNGIALWRASSPEKRKAREAKRRERALKPHERDAQIRVEAPRCPFCHDDVATNDPEKQACSLCMAWHHQDCWTEHGGCSSCSTGSHTNASVKE